MLTDGKFYSDDLKFTLTYVKVSRMELSKMSGGQQLNFSYVAAGIFSQFKKIFTND